MKNKERLIWALLIAPACYIIGLHKGKKKGDGMIELANEIVEQNSKTVDQVNERIREVNREWAKINRWKEENDYYD